jgi:hypothetical protein
MISARGPDSASADEPRIDVRAPLLRVARQTPRPLHQASAGASNRAVGPASNPFPSGLLPSGIGMAKPTIQQARDRAEVLWGATRPEWVTSAGSLERLLTGARKGSRMSAQGHECGSRTRSSNVRNGVDFSRSDANDWMATSGTSRTIRSASNASGCLGRAEIARVRSIRRRSDVLVICVQADS